MVTQSSAATPVSAALADLAKLKSALASTRTPQVRSAETRSQMKAVALAWFNGYREVSLQAAQPDALSPVDAAYSDLLTASERFPSALRMRSLVKTLRADLISLQTDIVSSGGSTARNSETPPSFSSIPDVQMQQVLERRWRECLACLEAGAPLAATVMMGGLLESLFLARVNRDSNKQAIFTASSAPKDSKTQKPLGLRDWTLNDFIAVAHELRWISQGVRDVSHVLRDYRNYIHPQKELSQQLALSSSDAKLFWQVFKAIAVKLL